MDIGHNRMERKFQEWMALDACYLFGLLLYIAVQLAANGGIEDIIFLVLLSAATLFLNYRQKNLYDTLSKSEEGKNFFESLYSRAEAKDQFRSIFFARGNDLAAVLFASVFCFVMWHFHVWEQEQTVKAAFIFFLFTANIPTGLAIGRLFKYFYYSVKWIKRIDFGLGIGYNFQVRFARKIRGKVLFTAATYCTVSLISILFTKIELNMIVALYSIFAVTLVIFSLTATDFMIEARRKEGFFEALDQVNIQISSELQSAIEQPGGDLSCLRAIAETKEHLNRERYVKFDGSKILSGIGLVLITVLPIVLQYLMEHLK